MTSPVVHVRPTILGGREIPVRIRQVDVDDATAFLRDTCAGNLTAFAAYVGQQLQNLPDRLQWFGATRRSLVSGLQLRPPGVRRRIRARPDGAAPGWGGGRMSPAQVFTFTTRDLPAASTPGRGDGEGQPIRGGQPHAGSPAPSPAGDPAPELPRTCDAAVFPVLTYDDYCARLEAAA